MTPTKPIKVKCPHCNAALAYPLSQGGERVMCEYCGGVLKIPRQATKLTDDDEWLRLDGDAPGAESTSVRSEGAAPRRAERARPDHSEHDEFLLPELPRPAAGPGNSGRPQRAGAPKGEGGASPPPLSDADLEALSGFGADPPPVTRSAKQVAAEVPGDGRFRVRCPVCESLTYARLDQVGKRIRCTDCESVIVVPAPPKPKTRYQPDMATAPVYRFSDGDEQGNPASRPQDPFRKSADELLRAAELAEETAEAPEWELPSFGAWFARLGKVLADPAILIHVGLLSLLAFVPVAIWLKLDAQAPVILLGMFAAGMVFAALVVACGFAVLQSVANGEERVSEWPVFDPFEWFGQVAVAFCAAAVAAGPVWLLARFVGITGLAGVFMAMFALFALYPIILMSMLDEQSVFVPFSTDVSKSIVRAPDQWGAAYLSSAALFGGMFMVYLVASVSAPLTGAALSIVVTIAGVFVYFGILGQLAYGIGQAINAPPMVNDIQREKKPGSDH